MITTFKSLFFFAVVSIYPFLTLENHACEGDYKVRCYIKEFGCIRSENYCNGHPNCEDGSDEELCFSNPECSTRRWYHQCKDSKHCIWVGFHCSGYDRCNDGLLDINCNSCRMGGFLCPNSSRCARPEMKCTGYDVCYDGSADQNCTTCNESGFLCTNKRCIRPEKLCNGRDECEDGGSSNMNCTSCFGGAKLCPGNNSRCYLPREMCNGLDTCGDGSTDTNCTACSQGAVLNVKTKQCLRPEFFCSGKDVSGDGTSDVKCKACSGDAFLCRNARCILLEKRCNGKDECGDGTSNLNCQACKANAFWCKEDDICISSSQVCNGIFDCSGGTDEITCPLQPSPKSRFNYGIIFFVICLIVAAGLIIWYIKYYKPELRFFDLPLKGMFR